MPSDLKELEKALKHKFARRELLEQALTHSSYARELEAQALSLNAGSAERPEGMPAPPGDNEQMEFLGDAVLGLVTSQTLFERFPQFHEGRLSKVRAYLVSERHLIRAATKLKIGQYLRLGRGEDKSGGREKVALQVDALEALLAALYLDAGMEAARDLILSLIIDPELKRLKQQVAQGLPITDFKSALQEALHSAGWPQPEYVMVKEEGPEHKKTFTMEARIHGPERVEYVGRSEGGTKKKAEQGAAEQALDYLSSLSVAAKAAAKSPIANQQAAGANDGSS